MTAYNVLDRGKLVPNEPEDITVILANLDAIAAVLNGNLDNANVAIGAAIAASKIAGFPNDVGKALLGDGSWGTLSGPSADLSVYQTRSEKGLASGYASLGADGKVPGGQLPAPGAIDLSGYQTRAEEGIPGGYASLDGSGKVPSAQLPAGLAATIQTGTHSESGLDNASWLTRGPVNFPVAFTSTPLVFLQLMATNGPVHSIMAQGITTTKFDIQLYNEINVNTINLAWMAIKI